MTWEYVTTSDGRIKRKLFPDGTVERAYVETDPDVWIPYGEWLTAQATQPSPQPSSGPLRAPGKLGRGVRRLVPHLAGGLAGGAVVLVATHVVR